eukprot:scaffold8160_cov126-Isochrysis_galbana.AAC.6
MAATARVEHGHTAFAALGRAAGEALAHQFAIHGGLVAGPVTLTLTRGLILNDGRRTQTRLLPVRALFGYAPKTRASTPATAASPLVSARSGRPAHCASKSLTLALPGRDRAVCGSLRAA